MEARSLADVLGVADPREPEAAPPEPAKPLDRRAVGEFCRSIVSSASYRASIMRRIALDQLPPQLETMLWDRGFGKVADKLEVKDVRPVEKMTDEQLAQRELVLIKLLQRARESKQESQGTVH